MSITLRVFPGYQYYVPAAIHRLTYSILQVFVTGALPPNAIVGGREADGRQIWIARAPYAVSTINYWAYGPHLSLTSGRLALVVFFLCEMLQFVHWLDPGKIDRGVMYISYGGKEIVVCPVLILYRFLMLFMWGYFRSTRATRSSLGFNQLFVGFKYLEGSLLSHSAELHLCSEFTLSLCIQTTHHLFASGGNEADGRSYWIAQGTVPPTTIIVSPGKVKLGSFGELFGIWWRMFINTAHQL